jgi:hypothetical protein
MEFWIKNRCQSCHHTYRFKALSDFDDASDVADKPCPKCAKMQKTRGMDVSAGKAPSVGGSNIVRAMDQTADIVMDNYQLTNLNSDGRPGAVMAPSLPPHQQQRADNFFSPSKRADLLGPRAKQMIAAAKQGKGIGAFAPPRDPRTPDPIALVQATRQRPPVQLLNPRDRNGNIIS